MGDDRPPVYRTDAGLYVFRFSSIDRCEKAMVAHSIGVNRYPTTSTPTKMQVKYDEGSEAEPLILARFMAGEWGGPEGRGKWKFNQLHPVVAWPHCVYGVGVWHNGVDDPQVELEIPVGSRALLRGKPDAIAQCYTRPAEGYPEIPDGRVVVEVKALGDSFYDRFLSKGIAGFDYYAQQMTLEMLGTGMPGAFVVAHKNADGTVDAESDIRVEWCWEYPWPVSKIKAKVARVIRLIEKGDVESTPCKEPKDYPCPFWSLLHDEGLDDPNAGAGEFLNDVAEMNTIADSIAHYAAVYDHSRVMEKEWGETKKSAGTHIAELFDEAKLKGKKLKVKRERVTDEMPGSQWEVTDYVNVREVDEIKTVVYKAGETRYPKIKRLDGKGEV